MRKSLNLLICALLLVAFAIVPSTGSTAEAATSALMKELQEMADKGIVQGYANGDLRANDPVTRGQFAKFMAKALELPRGPHIFTDVPVSSPLAEGINSAAAANLIKGYSETKFDPNKRISRQEAAMIIYRALTNIKGVTSKNQSISFTDTVNVKADFKTAIHLNAEYGIINGYSNNDGTNSFRPSQTATRAQAAAFISRMLKVPNSQQEIKVDPALFTIHNIEGETLKATTNAFTTLESAKAAIAVSKQVVLHQDKLVYMTNGFAYPNKAAITLYVRSDFSQSDTIFSYVKNQEMKFLDATAEYVKVQVANTIAYAKPNDVSLVPMEQVKNRNYYSVNDAGLLVHHVYSEGASYFAGKAPSFLKKGEIYYSWNGTDFTTKTGVEVGSTVYQYFNYLSARTTTSYTAEELNNYINKKLAEREATGSLKYKEATTRSKIIGIGTKLKAAEAEYNINALMMLGVAIHESDYGMSPVNALVKNNLFGIEAFDGTNDARSFTTVDESIDVFAREYLNKNYIEPGAMYFHGAVLGNKSTGFNVKYAADPFWGQKIAGHMYLIDQALGGKDIGDYRIFETNQTSVKVRSTPGTFAGATTVIITYKNSGVPVTVKGSTNHQENGQTWEWFEIIPDTKAYTIGYSRSDVITELTIVK